MAGADTEQRFANRILNALPPATLARLRPRMTPETLPLHRTLYRVGDSVGTLHFVERGIASLIQTMQDGRTVELGAIGIEGVTGANAIFDGGIAILECVVQIPGSGLAIERNVLRDEMARDPVLTKFLQGYQNLMISQLAQTAACNRLHTLEARCCRWLLTAHDSAGADTFPLTHEFLAMMLGVRRPGVTLAARSLQQAGLIRYSRGRVTIADRDGLQREACECYGTIHRLIEQLFARH